MTSLSLVSGMTNELRSVDSHELSTDINTITAEINAYQRVAGEAIFEIGRRLKHVKENDLVHGEWAKWLETINMKPRQAQRFTKVFERFGKTTPGSHFKLGMSVLYELTEFDDEELEEPHEMPDGSTKKLTEMSRRQIEELDESNMTTSFNSRVEREKARERMEVGKAADPSQKSDEGRADDIAAEQSGFGSRDTFRKAQFIDDNADAETIAKLDAEYSEIK